MRRSGEKIFSFWHPQSGIMRAIASLSSASLSLYKAGSWTWQVALQCIVNSFRYMLLSVLTKIAQNIFNIAFSFIFNYWIAFCSNYRKRHLVLSIRVCLGLWCLNKRRHPLMSQVIGQVWREVVGCRNRPVGGCHCSQGSGEMGTLYAILLFIRIRVFLKMTPALHLVQNVYFRNKLCWNALCHVPKGGCIFNFGLLITRPFA